jgi:molecular chaperone DnaK (HSP70)
MSIIVHRNSKVPHNYIKYETIKDDRKEVDIEIYECEETMAKDNRKLRTFSLINIPPGPAGEQ